PRHRRLRLAGRASSPSDFTSPFLPTPRAACGTLPQAARDFLPSIIRVLWIGVETDDLHSHEADGAQPARHPRAHRHRARHLRVATEQLRSRTNAYLWSLALLALGVLIAAAALALILERMISRPLLALAAVSRTIAETKDYSVRAEHAGGDEIGLLGGAFNHM